MKANLKALALALLAVFATSAMVAQAASAENHEFTVTKAPAVLTGESSSKHVFAAGGSPALTCDAFFQGTQEREAEDHIKVFPEYTNCEFHIFGGLGATVTNNDCTYTLESDTDETGKAPVALTCNHEGSITVVDEFNFCILHFSDTHTGVEKTVNQVLSGVTFENVGGGEEHDVVLTWNMTGTTYEATQSGCELFGIETGTHHDGAYVGTTTVKAYEDDDDPETVHVYEHNEVDAGFTVELNTES